MSCKPVPDRLATKPLRHLNLVALDDLPELGRAAEMLNKRGHIGAADGFVVHPGIVRGWVTAWNDRVGNPTCGKITYSVMWATLRTGGGVDAKTYFISRDRKVSKTGAELVRVAKACQVTPNFLYMVVHGHKPCSPRLACALEHATKGRVDRRVSLPDFPWDRPVKAA